VAPGGRVLGVDLGERRVGLAVSDPSGTIASPLRILERREAADDTLRAVVLAAREVGAERVVVGLPRSLGGDLGRAAHATLAEVETLRRLAGPGLPVETHDERLTTVMAEQALAATGRKRGRRRARRAVDDAAAAVMLQGWLDAHRG